LLGTNNRQGAKTQRRKESLSSLLMRVGFELLLRDV
jgi:hypothetical protein